MKGAKQAEFQAGLGYLTVKPKPPGKLQSLSPPAAAEVAEGEVEEVVQQMEGEVVLVDMYKMFN